MCGGSRGIGKAVSRLLAERGCRLVVVSRNKDAAQAAVASLHGGIQTVSDCADTADFNNTSSIKVKKHYLSSELANLAHTGANTK